MCLIIVKPVGVHVPKDHVKNGFAANPDGAGYMYVADGKVCIHKGYMNFEPFWKDLIRDAKAHRDSPFVLHMRIGTSGVKSADTCHPFMLRRGIGFAHNGILRDFSEKGDKSDTMLFAERVLDTLPKGFLRHVGIMSMVETVAKASSSKFAFLTPAGEVVFCNESAGTWDKGAWYSNDGYKPTRRSWSWPEKDGRRNRFSWTEPCEMCDRQTDRYDLVEIEDLLLCEDCAAVYREGDPIYLERAWE